MKSPAFIATTSITVLFLFASLLYAATKAEVLQAIAVEKAQVQAALVTSTSMQCETAYWGHNMISAREENGVWYYSCQIPWTGTGRLATNVYYAP